MGQDFEKNKEEIKSNMGVTPQDIVIFEDLTAKENLEYFGSLYGLRGNRLIESVDETLEFIGLTNVKKKFPRTFSGGMKRRLNIGCAIVHQPRIIILDEPTVGIDAQSRNHILASIKELNARGATVIYTSHYMEEVEAICDDIIIIDQGEIIEQGEKEALISKYNNERKFDIMLAKNPDKKILSKINGISGVKNCKSEGSLLEITTSIEGNALKMIIELLEKEKFDFISIDMKKMNLENIFLLLTGRKLRD